MTIHALIESRDRYVICSCGKKFGPGPYKMKALKAHIRDGPEDNDG